MPTYAAVKLMLLGTLLGGRQGLQTRGRSRHGCSRLILHRARRAAYITSIIPKIGYRESLRLRRGKVDGKAAVYRHASVIVASAHRSFEKFLPAINGPFGFQPCSYWVKSHSTERKEPVAAPLARMGPFFSLLATIGLRSGFERQTGSCTWWPSTLGTLELLLSHEAGT